MKKLLFRAFLTGLLFSIFSSFCWAQDFASMSNKELFELRGMIKFSVEEVKKAYNEEWEKRLADMSDEEKNRYAEAEEKEGEDDKLWLPGRGYERQGVQGQIIYGGPPRKSSRPQK